MFNLIGIALFVSFIINLFVVAVFAQVGLFINCALFAFTTIYYEHPARTTNMVVGLRL